MSYEAIDPLKLPSIALERRAALLPVPAVYFLIEADRQVIYVGQAVNLRSRWVAHHCLEGYPSIAGLRIAWIEIEDATMRTRAERSLIGRYRLRLNCIYNPQLLLPPAPSEREGVMEEVGLTTEEVAQRLGLSTGRVRAMIQAGRLPAAQRFGRAYMIREADLALVADRKPGRPPQKKKRRVAA